MNRPHDPYRQRPPGLRLFTGPTWLAYLLAVPAVIGLVLLAAFFFAAFLALFTVTAIGVALRIWWLRRKLRKQAAKHGAVDAEYTMVRDYRSRIEKDD